MHLLLKNGDFPLHVSLLGYHLNQKPPILGKPWCKSLVPFGFAQILKVKPLGKHLSFV